MQNKFKLATFLAAVFVALVFAIQYFFTTTRTIMSVPENYNPGEQNYSDETSSDQETDIHQEEKEETHEDDPILEGFDYNTPITEVDPKSVKKDKKKLSYSNYDDRIRMESPVYLDANGLYVALMSAVEDNDIKRAKSLIARGVKLNSPDGNTSYAPIFWAIANGNVEMVDLLLQKGAKVNTPDDNGLFPIHWIVENSANRPNVYQMKAIFDLLLDAHPEEINRQDTLLLQTPLMTAVNLNDRKAFAYLLDKGANITILNKDKRNIIDLSLENACPACIILIQRKEKQNQITPLPNFASSFTAPDPVWLPYSTAKKTTKKKKQNRNLYEVVITGESIDIPVYKDMPDI